MSSRAVIRSAAGDIETGDEFADRAADSDALKLGKTNRAMLAPAGLGCVRVTENGGERRGAAVDAGEITTRRWMQTAAQIMMALEERPNRPLDAAALQRDPGTPKPPPC
jgi:hypothetical protein